MAIKKTEKHVSKKVGKGGYTYSVNLNSPSKIPATKQKARREAKNTVVQIGRARPTDVEFPIRVSKKTREGLLRMANGEGVVKITEADLMAAVEKYFWPKAEPIDAVRIDNGQPMEIDMISMQAEEPINILMEANKIIYGDREKAYGNPRFNLDSISAFWNVYLNRKFPEVVSQFGSLYMTAEDVAQMMILLKTARLIHNPTHVDSLTDQAGYASLQHRIQGM